MNNPIRLESVNHIDNIDTNAHRLLDLVRRLETSDFVFATDPKVATNLAKASDGTPTEKLIYRTNALDTDGKLQHALHKADFLIKSVDKAYAGISFIIGFVGALGLLSTQIINFFYVLLGLLGWHTITLIWWLIGLKNPNPYSSIYGIFDKIHPKSPIQAHAFDIYLEEFEQNAVWQLGKTIHKAWLFGLLGSILALFVMFLFKSYAFVWESTLLTQEHFAMILKGFGFVPSLFGFDLPSQASLMRGDVSAGRLAMLMMMSVAIYGMIPRFCAYLLCRLKANWQFRIDNNLYYYENLKRQFSQTIINQDDFSPTTPKATPKTNTTQTIVVATLEYPTPSTWWQDLTTAHTIKNVGNIDQKSDIIALIETANTLKAMICLGIDANLLPDRGVLRKLDEICQGGQNGVMVRFIDDGDHFIAWQQALVARHLHELT